MDSFPDWTFQAPAALLLASDPTTSPEILLRLWYALREPTTQGRRLDVQRVRERIAAHPSLPAELAATSLARCPDAFFAGLAAPRLLDANPDLLARAPRAVIERQLRCEIAPRYLLERLRAHPTHALAEAASMHIVLAGPLPTGAACRPTLRATLSALPDGSRAHYHLLHTWGLIPGWLAARRGLRPQGGAQPSDPTAVLTTLSPRARPGLAGLLILAQTPIEADLRRAAVDGAWSLRLGAALNPRIPPGSLDRLARDGDRRVQAAARTRRSYPGIEVLS